jgi:tripartite-type tricarboxylate transporter receptor subunit TctC
MQPEARSSSFPPEKNLEEVGMGFTKGTAAAATACLCLFAAVTATAAQAQPYPQRPIRAVVPYVAGASYDTIMRIVGEALAESMKQPVIVENRPGASAMIGADMIAKATPDGYTIGMLGDNHTILAAVNRKTPYDIFRDFAPLMRVASLDNVIVVHPSLPASSLQQLIALLKSSPGKYRYGSGGVGGSTHLAGARFAQMAGVNIQHVPYKGGGLAVTGLLGNEVQIMVANMISSKAQVLSGRMRALAVAAPKRSSHLPNVPTAAESGLPGLEVSQFYAMVAPVKTPQRILSRLESELRRATGLAEVRKKFDNQGADAYAETPADLAAFLKSNIAGYREAAKAAGIQPD